MRRYRPTVVRGMRLKFLGVRHERTQIIRATWVERHKPTRFERQRLAGEFQHRKEIARRA